MPAPAIFTAASWMMAALFRLCRSGRSARPRATDSEPFTATGAVSRSPTISTLASGGMRRSVKRPMRAVERAFFAPVYSAEALSLCWSALE